MFQSGTDSIGLAFAVTSMVIRLALALFGDELSPRFCFAKLASLVEWDGTRARGTGQVQLGTLPYPARLEVLAEQRVQWLLCGSFPRARLVDAARCGIAVHCGLSGQVPLDDEQLTNFILGLPIPVDAPVGRTVPLEPESSRRHV